MSRRSRFRAGDLVTYRVWTYTPGGFVQVDREARVSALAGEPYGAARSDGAKGRRRLTVVPAGHIRLITQNDGSGKRFTLPLTEVHAR